MRDVFDRAAGSYDRINAVLSLGTGAWYRRHALLQAGLRPGMRMLDVAVGTGLVAREAVRILSRTEDVIGLDLSAGMLGVARRSLPIPLIQARAEALPLADASVDFISMGYALRHVTDLAVLFAEFGRVLRPGGRVLVLEIAKPESRLAYALAKAYVGVIVPGLSRLGGADSGMMMRYYWDTIEACVPPAEIMRHLRESGLEQVGCETSVRIFRAYSAQRA
ncbi:MAG: dimethylmenaquinone methyltransferase [Rubritepida sp.]|nr:dimethylmenaquinone methyltransferase [Rubritepida sp.]